MAFSQDVTGGAKLLLTPQRLRRLERDRDRQTVRWINFEKRIRTTADSTERGFELALYYAVTHDEQSGREAIDWALNHSCETRQVALIFDWTKNLSSNQRLAPLLTAACDHAVSDSGMEAIRNEVFRRVVTGNTEDPVPMDRFNKALAQFRKDLAPRPESLYALCELIDAVRGAKHLDLREPSAEYFAHLPTMFLLTMKPQQIDAPTWRARVAGQILVAIDPNLQESQFLQGWAMEEGAMISQGEGVAYEYLWGNPYMPGVSYQNLDPWEYDEHEGRLFARSDWTSGSCWISVSPKDVQALQCPSAWRTEAAKFGHLTLLPFIGRCIPVPPIAMNGDAAIVWGLKPMQRVTFQGDDKPQSQTADAAGMLRIPITAQTKVCLAK